MSALRRVLSVVLLIHVLGGGSSAIGDELEARRINTALAIFPRIVAVDEDIDNKLDADKRVQLVVAYSADSVSAQNQASALSSLIPNIGGRPLAVRALSIHRLLSADAGVVSGVFIADPFSNADLERLLAFARERHILVFSPFSGDVERGVPAGIAVGSQVKPYFNVAALNRSKIVVNPTLLRISKHYD